MSGHVPAEVGDGILQMQDGVREWVQRTAVRSKREVRSASPAILLSLLCASAFAPLLMATGVAAAGVGVLSSVGGGFLTQVVSDALDRLRQRGQARTLSRDDLEKGIAQQIQEVLAAGDERANDLRSEIASVLKEIDAGGTALRAAMEQGNEKVRSDVIAAIGVLGSDFSELGFLLKDIAQAAEEIQKSLDVQGADVRVIIEQNVRQSTDIRLVREDLALIASRARSGEPVGAGRDDGAARWVRGCPYRGLLPFDESDEEVFYGRERLTAELAVNLAARVTRGGLVVVTGASGAGKSSLLRAGLLPILSRGQQVQGSDHWPRVVMTPAKDPLTELAAHLAAIGGNNTIAVRDGLVQHPDQAHLAVWSTVLADAARHDEERGASRGSTARLVLIVDQFEQVFTLSPGPGGEAPRQAFVTALCAAATNPVGAEQEPPALVVIAVRGDFWDRCAAYPELAGALQDGQFVVGPMTGSELRVAITGPADAAGLRIDPALTDTILSDLRAAGGDDTAGALPLLSQAMSLTWEKREGDRLTSRGYGQTGGVGHAVQTGADRAYDGLPAGQQALARDVLRSMTVASRDGRFTRRPLTRADLYAMLPNGDRSQIDAVLEAFAAERLIVLNDDTAQISHDILLRAWPKLRNWLEEDQASWILYGELADAAAAWHDSNDDPSFLYRGSHLTTVQQAVTRWSANPARYPVLTGIERGFLYASGKAATRSSRQRRTAVAALAVLALLASALSVYALIQGARAVRARNQAVYNELVARGIQSGISDTPLAAQLNLAAYGLQRTPSLASRLLSTENTPLASFLPGDTGTVDAVAFSPDRHTLATSGYYGTLRLWDVTDPTHPRLLSQPLTRAGTVLSLAFSRNGRLLAATGGEGLVRIWDIQNLAHPRLLSQRPAKAGAPAVATVAFSYNSRTLAIGDFGGYVSMWDVTDAMHPRPLGHFLAGTGIVNSVAFSPDGRTLASGTGTSHGIVRLWNLANPAHAKPLGQPIMNTDTSGVTAVIFSPNGHTLASGNGDGRIRLWDVTNPAHPRPLQPLASLGRGSVNSVAFSPNGRALVGGNDDGSLELWDIADPAEGTPLGQPITGGAGTINSVAFSSDGRTLASGDADGSIQVWSLAQTVMSAGGGTINSVAFSPGGHTLASGNGFGTVALWGVTNPERPRLLGQSPSSASSLNAVAFSPNGHMLASGSADGAIELWDVTHPAHPRLLGQSPPSASAVKSVAFSPNSPMLASGSTDGAIRLWDVTHPAHPRLLGESPGSANTVFSVAFSLNGHMLASGSTDGAIRLWDVTHPAHPRPLGQSPVSAGYVSSVAFSHVGNTLASGSGNGTVQLWDVANPAHPRPLGPPVTGGAGIVYSVAFSHDGNTLASGGSDGTLRLWNVTDPAHPRALSQPLSNAGLGAIYSVALSPNGRTLASGGLDETIRLWKPNVHYAIERICTTEGSLTRQQWHQYIPDWPYQSPCTH